MQELSQDFFAEKSSRMQDEEFYIIPPSAEKQMEPENPLSAYVRKVMKDNDLTVVDVQNEARRRGGTLGKSTVNAIIQGTTPNPGIFTLRELAWGLSKPIKELLAVTLETEDQKFISFGEVDVDALAELYEQLRKADQRFIDHVFEMVEREMRRILRGY